MEKQLYKSYEESFRLGAAVGGLFYDEEGAFKKHQRFLDFLATHPKPEGMPDFPKPEFPKGPFVDTEIVSKHFNLVVAENDTKMVNMYPRPNEYDFTSADKFIEFAKKNGQDIRWHTLVWHNQSPKWIFEDENGNKVSKEVLEQRLHDYIMTIGKRYSKDICSVDVVNECISDKNFCLRDGNDRSQWFDILGPDYVDKAFIWAKEAFPNSSLVINDYNLEMIPGKRQGMYELVKGMKERGVPVDTVGLQMHINMEYPPVSEIEKTIELYGSLGLNVIVTEMEISVYNDHSPDGKECFQERKEYTPELMEKQAQRYKEIFDCFEKEAKKGILKDVILWGITDRFTWKNNFPVPGRTDAPLLFDTEGNPKPAFYKLCKGTDPKSSIRIGTKTCKNRITMAPTVKFYAGDDGLVTDDYVKHYEERAAHECGFICVEATCVAKEARLAPTQLGLWNDEQIEGHKKIADACHKYGALVVPQIHHGGLGTHLACGTLTSPTKVLWNNGTAEAVELTKEDIKRIIQQFIDAAIRAQKAGYDGVQLHGCHSYLINDFASAVNKRTDEYGGSTENLARFGCEIISGIRKACGKDFIISVRVSGCDPNVKEAIEIAEHYVSAGCDFLQVSTGIFGLEEVEHDETLPYNRIASLGVKFHEHFKGRIPVSCVNGLRNVEVVNYLFEHDSIDTVDLACGLLADPAFTEAILYGAPYVKCFNCKDCGFGPMHSHLCGAMLKRGANEFENCRNTNK